MNERGSVILTEKEINLKMKTNPEKADRDGFGPFHYVIHSIAKHRMRTVLTIMGIAVPIAFFVLFAAMGEGLDQYLIEQAESKQPNREDYIEMSNIVSAWTEILMVIIAVMIVTSIANTILMSTSERKYEFGVLKAVGISQEQILYLVLLEALVISIFALIVGIIIGFWGAILFDYMFWLDEGSGFFFAPAKITYNSLMIVSILTLLIGAITAIYPAHLASKADTIKIIRAE
jgi:ABC-type antimicrobial peptide transport system permease subunit